MNQQELSKAFDEGARAHNEGVSIRDCPYGLESARSTLLAAEWRRGWRLHAQHIASRMMRRL